MIFGVVTLGIGKKLKRRKWMMDVPDKGENKSNARNVALMDLVGQIQNENTKNYVIGRIMPQMEWYSSKGGECKKKYYRWMASSILLGALIPVVSVFADGAVWTKVLLAALGSAVTACNAFMALHNFKDLWLNYRNTREKLLRVLYYYFNDAGIFSKDMQQGERDILLINICEEEMAGENGEWMKLGKVI